MALIERHLMGSDCLNVGCVPSKGVIAASRAWTNVRSSAIYPYPTRAEVVKRVANAWRRSTFTEGKRNMLKRWFAWTR